MFEKVEQFVRWVAGDDISYSVSMTTDSRTIVIQRVTPLLQPRNLSMPPSSSSQSSLPTAQTRDRAQSSCNHEPRPGADDLTVEGRNCLMDNIRILGRPTLNPETPEFQPNTRPSSSASDSANAAAAPRDDNGAGSRSEIILTGPFYSSRGLPPSHDSEPAFIGGRRSPRRGISASSINVVNRHLAEAGSTPAYSNLQLSLPAEPPGYRVGQTLTIRSTWIEDDGVDDSGKSYSHVCTHAHTHTRTHIYTNTHIHTHIYTHIYTHTHTPL